MLTPVTSENSGRPLPDHPVRTPAPNAPSSPPAESASQGPGRSGRASLKSTRESAKNRASGKAGIVART